MSHGADGSHGGAGSSFDHGMQGMHGLGYDHQGFSHGNHNFDHNYGFGLNSSHHGGAAMLAALNGSSHAASHYSSGGHTLAFVSGYGMIGGHVVNFVNDHGPVLFNHGSHADSGTNRNWRFQGKQWRDIKISDIEDAQLLVAHGLGLKDHGSGYYNRLLDQDAKSSGLLCLGSRPNLKAEDSLGLDGILPWNAWGDFKSRVGPDGYLPMLDGTTDRIIHFYAIPHMAKVNGVKKLVVSPDEVVVLAVRLTVWHGAQTRDVEFKMESVISSGYVYDPWQGGQYTKYGRKTKALSLAALQMTETFFTTMTAKGEQADPKFRREFGDRVFRLPHLKGLSPVYGDHEVGVRVGTADEVGEIAQEEIDGVRKQDREIENTVATGAAGDPPVPAPAGDGATDDGMSLSGPEVTGGAVVAGPSPGPVSGTFVIPLNDLRD